MNRGSAVDSRPHRRLLLEKLPWLALSAAVCIVTVTGQRGGGAAMELATLDLLDRATKAIEQYREALVRQPGNPSLHAALARALHAEGHVAEGETSNRDALAIDANHVTAHAQLARIERR